jgi:hypothetical protein
MGIGSHARSANTELPFEPSARREDASSRDGLDTEQTMFQADHARSGFPGWIGITAMQRNRSAAALRRTAIHEAGHAVIGRVLDLDCGPVSVEPDEDSTGHAVTADPWQTAARWDREFFERAERDPRLFLQGRGPRQYEDAVFARALMLMAGAEAEIEFLGRCAPGDDDDRKWIVDCIREIERADDWDRYEARLRRQCRRLVRRHRAGIDRIAQELLRRRKLEGDEVTALLR